MDIIKLDATASTNSYLREYVKKRAPKEALVVVAKSQTQGRGQRQNTWSSKTGESLTFSMFKRFEALAIDDNAVLTFATSIGVLQELKRLGIPNVSVKWPNDIMSYNKKVAGILIENQIHRSKIVSSIIGVGINVNESHFSDLPQASSLRLMTGQHFDLEEVLTGVTTSILRQVEQIEGQRYDQLRTAYKSNLFRKDQVSVFETAGGSRFNGIIKSVTACGELQIEKESGSLETFQLKEIKLLF